MAEVIAVANQKGGVGKTMSTAHLGIGIARQGKRVLLIDGDPQGNLTSNLGFGPIDKLTATLADYLQSTRERMGSGILHHKEGVDIVPANQQLSVTERDLTTSGDMQALTRCLQAFKADYDYILIDSSPSLGALTLNALTAANHVVIPVQAQTEAVQGMQQLIRTIGSVQRHQNPDLKIGGILFTMVDANTNLARTIMQTIQSGYGQHLRILSAHIPRTVMLAETGVKGRSVYVSHSKSKAAQAYEAASKEVIAVAERSQEQKHHRTDPSR